MDILKFKLEIDSDLIWRLMLVLCAAALIFSACDSAFASGTDNDIVGATLCRLVSNLTGRIAKSIATIAIFAVGVGLFLGKLNWGIAAATAAGVGIIFGAEKLVSFLAGTEVGASANCGKTS